jgi:hypothetical protein
VRQERQGVSNVQPDLEILILHCSCPERSHYLLRWITSS